MIQIDVRQTLLLLLILAIGIVLLQLADIRRYLRIRTM